MQIAEEKIVYKLPKTLKEGTQYPFCAGCDHGIAIRLVAEILEELNLQEKALAIASSGCSVNLYHWLDVDCVEAPHGRAMAVATGAKRTNPERFVFTYQGDGDFASIGIAESLHASLRGERLSAICINNTLYGMTGGQMAPTTVMGQITTTSPDGRNREYHGFPIKAAELIAQCEGCVFSARGAVDTVANIKKTKEYIKKAFEAQLSGQGTGFVEILSSCPTNWKMTPQQAHERIRNELFPVYPLGIVKGN